MPDNTTVFIEIAEVKSKQHLLEEDIKTLKAEVAKVRATRIFHQNVDRIGKKVDRLNHLLNMTHPDIVVLTHGLDPTTIKSTKLMDYNLVMAYGRDYHQKGGVAIYKSEKLDNHVESLDIEEHSEELICEMTGIKLLSDKDLPLLILGIYRPPSTPILDALALIGNGLDTILCGDSSVVVIVGDLNANSLDPTNNDTIRLQEFLTSYNIHRLELCHPQE
ncbi:hypothetical protein J6590_053508 [Homalodisca vitripennis]|nr:hypothetical protein J6590_053508 [Homalodisca vitripennis]